MSSLCRVLPGRYVDSVALLAATARLRALDGITAASAVMATPANLKQLHEGGFATPDASPNDLVVSVGGEEAACRRALQLVEELLRPQRPGTGADTNRRPPPRTLHEVARTLPDQPRPRGLAMISVPGPFAAGEAAKALVLGFDVFLFSDNVSLADEVALKDRAEAVGLLVMGPDCGTAILDGIPLGFANEVRRGNVGVVSASGTGAQEVASRIDALGSGVSQVYGTGGRDLSEEVGGRAMVGALRRLRDDEATEVIVLISKPPNAFVEQRVLDEASRIGKPVVVAFLRLDLPTGRDPRPHVTRVATLAAAADVAVSLVPPSAVSPQLAPAPPTLTTDTTRRDHRLPTAVTGPSSGRDQRRRYARGAFCGGTFCYETQLILQRAGLRVASNAPVTGNAHHDGNDWRADSDELAGVLLDLGADEFTRGRPHPMIAPDLRDEMLVAAWNDPTSAVVVFDVVLGHGAHLDPIVGLLSPPRRVVLRQSIDAGVVTIAHVCGTDRDPQPRAAIVAALQDAGVLVADSNAHAATWVVESFGLGPTEVSRR